VAPGEARALVERSRALIEQTPDLGPNLRASLLLVEAWLAQQEDREQDCLRLLREALQLSQVGYNWCQMRYVDTTGARMFRLALERGIEPGAAKRLDSPVSPEGPARRQRSLALGAACAYARPIRGVRRRMFARIRAQDAEESAGTAKGADRIGSPRSAGAAS